MRSWNAKWIWTNRYLLMTESSEMQIERIGWWDWKSRAIESFEEVNEMIKTCLGRFF